MQKSRHGLTNDEIYAIAKHQGFVCPLSKLPLEDRGGEIYDSTTGKRVAIDHDHNTGLIRGLCVQKINWLIDQWEQNSYGALSMPREILEYKNNPPAFRVIGQRKYT